MRFAERPGSGWPSDHRTCGQCLRRRQLNSVCDSAKNPMDQDHGEPTLADMLSDPVTLAVMDADGVDPRDLAATLSKMAGKLMRPPGPFDQKQRFAGSALAKAVTALSARRTSRSNHRKTCLRVGTRWRTTLLSTSTLAYLCDDVSMLLTAQESRSHGFLFIEVTNTC
jgi:hypothetical protein